MLVQTQRQIATLLTAVVVTAMSGCGQSGFDSHFVSSDKTESLIKEAQNGVGDLPGVNELVSDRFGTPQQLNAWMKLPVDFGGVSGSVSAAPEASIAVEELSLKFDGEVIQVDSEPLLVQFVTGAAAPAVVEIKRWSAEKGVASLTAAMETLPAEGDTVILNGGSHLKTGRQLYMRHCSHCHGTSGDAAGPTAEYLNPRPRDYRHGVFKFTSTNAQSKAARDDIRRVLQNGVPGTYMPSFVPMLKDNELDIVVEYVRFLALRGEFERRLVSELAPDYSKDAMANRMASGETRSEVVNDLKEFLAEDLQDSIEGFMDGTNGLATVWTNANLPEATITPDAARVPNSAESRRIGRELYLSKAINCADCHGIGGKGNGPQTTIFEKNVVTETLYPEPGLHDVWDNVNQPRNLTLGIYRGGRRPIDLFCRIQAGIKGTRMPSFKNLKHEDIWHIVNYVLSIPFEPEPGKGPTPAPAAATTP